MAHRSSPAEVAAALERDGYAVVPELVPRSLVDRVRRSLEPHLGAPDAPGRLTNAWMALPPVAELAALPAVTELLEPVLGGRAVPFQTLDFRLGTQQRPHADTIHFDTVPTGGVCGVWVALEDVGADQGPLVVHPGSHRLAPLDPSSFGRTPEDFDVGEYEDRMEAMLAEAGLPGRTLPVVAGDAVVWAAGLVHGGAAVTRPGSTRWSQVTHYAREGSVVVTPLASDVPAGEYLVRDPLPDVARSTAIRWRRPAGGPRVVHRPGRRSLVLGPLDPPPTTAAAVLSRATGLARWLRWQAVRRVLRRVTPA